MLDGLVRHPDLGNHVVRGTANKVTYYNEAASSSSEDENGNLKTIEVYSQKVVLEIRAIWADGTIQSFTDATEAKADAAPMAEPDTVEVQFGPDAKAAVPDLRGEAMVKAAKLLEVTVIRGATAAEALTAREKAYGLMDEWNITHKDLFAAQL